MAEITSSRTANQSWQVELAAFQINAFVYKAIGATIRAYHWEVSGILWWRKERWVERPAEFLSLRVSYEGAFASAAPGQEVRGRSASDASACDERLWAIGAGVTFDATADTGSRAECRRLARTRNSTCVDAGPSAPRQWLASS
jgi:hypothetical protein